jgi:hypothetical protein
MLYYKAGADGPAYDGTEANEGESPTDVGLSTTFTRTGLDETGTYFFTLTAYNDNAESGYSNAVCVNCPTKTNMQNGGGGGGCFIAAAASGSAVESYVLEGWRVYILTLARIFHELLSRDHVDGRATW